MFIKTNKS
uniref:Uncharacterized protein n=1 Tax=Arundo donax TaxID=35708 RepID=A0A0A9C3X7_ARUDO